MCDAKHVANTLLSTCFNGDRFLCSNLGECPNAKWTGLLLQSAKVARLCDAHVEFCIYCGDAFCPTCRTAHQEACPRRPGTITAWEFAARAFEV